MDNWSQIAQKFQEQPRIVHWKEGKRGQEHPHVWESVFLPPMDISTGIFSTNFLVLSMHGLHVQLTTAIA